MSEKKNRYISIYIKWKNLEDIHRNLYIKRKQKILLLNIFIFTITKTRLIFIR